MAALQVLLDRFCEQYQVATPDQLIRQFDEREERAEGGAWYAWCHAERALRTSSPQRALAWLNLAWDHLSARPDPLCELEVLSSLARAHDWLDEVRDAAPPAAEAWRRWLDLAKAPTPERVVPSARVLLSVLSQPEPEPDLDDIELFVAWLHDRLILGLEYSTRLLMNIHGTLEMPEAAEGVAQTYLAWADRRAAEASTVATVTRGNILLALGDIIDRCGDSARALEIFDEALSGLAATPDHTWLTARLHFNRGNQLTKLERYGEALVAFEQAAAEMGDQDSPEARLRVQHAIAFVHYKQGTLSDRPEELASLAASYEQELRAAGDSSAEIQTRMVLDRVYRLWVRVLAERFDASDARGVLKFLMLLFALKEEEGKVAGQWQRMESTQAVIHSEITVLADRIERRPGSCLLILEQVPDAMVLVSFRDGPGPWHERVHVAMVEGPGVEKFTRLAEAHRDAVEAMSDRAMPVNSAPAPDFVSSCRDAWDALPGGIRRDLEDADVVLLCVDYQSDMDQLPVELLHDGTTYLGLRVCIVQAPSLRDLNALFGENRVNAAPTGTAIIVRSDDELVHADVEAQTVRTSLEQAGLNTVVLGAPEPGAVNSALRSGVDLFHYVGHGLADRIGEELPLGPNQSLTARDLATLGPTPAPLTFLSACLVGRGRQLRTGEQHGFATTLLRRGAPAVLATKQLLPDHVGTNYFALLHHFAAELPVDEAARMTRRTLATQGCHPAAWSCFVLFGRPDVSLRAPHRQEATTWPGLALRHLATGSAGQLTRALSLLEDDERLTHKQRERITQDLRALASGDATHFSDERTAGGYGLDEHAEARLTTDLIHAFGRLRTAGTGADSQADHGETAQDALSVILAIEPILCDTYVLVAAAVELWRSQPTYALHEGRSTVLLATRRLSWLTADDALAATREELENWAEQTQDTLYVDVASMAGVDADTLEVADEGDRMAQKRMLVSMLAASASPEALVATDWIPWLLEVVALGSEASLGNAVGAIGQAARSGRISAQQHDALVRLVEMYLGPGAVDPDIAVEALAAFEGTGAAAAVQLFLLHDSLASYEQGIDLAEIDEGAQAADEIGAAGAAAYFRGVWAERAFVEGRYDDALETATLVVEAYESLLTEDPEYSRKHTGAVLLTAQIAGAADRADVATRATEAGATAVEDMLSSPDTTDEFDDLVRAAAYLLVIQGQVARARALLHLAGDQLGEGVRGDLERLVGQAPHFPTDLDEIEQHGSRLLQDGDFVGAVEWLTKAREGQLAADGQARCCGLLGDLAVALRGLGNAARAIETYREAINLCRRYDDQVNLSRWCQNLALVLAERGDRDEAFALFEEALEAAEQSGDRYQLSAAIGNLGRFRAEAEDFEGALTAFDEALEYADDEELAAVWRGNRRAAQAISFGADEQRIPVFEEDTEELRACLQAAVAAGDVAAELDARTRLAVALMLDGSPEALEALDAAMARARETGDEQAELNLCLDFTSYLLDISAPNRALDLAQRAAEIAGDAATPLAVLAALRLARVWDEGYNDEDEAFSHHQRAVRLLEEALAAAPEETLPIVEAEGVSLLRGALLAVRRTGTAEALRMIAVWNPDGAALLGGLNPLASTPSPGQPEPDDTRDPELAAVLGSWRAAALPAADTTDAAEARDDSPIDAMILIAEITGWTEALDRLGHARGLVAAPVDERGPAVLLELAWSVAGGLLLPDEAAERAVDLELAEDDLPCLLLYAFVDPEMRASGAIMVMFRLVADVAAEGRVAGRALDFLSMFQEDPEDKLSLLEEGAERLGDGTDELVRAHLLVEQTAVLIQLGRFEEALQQAQEALPLADALGDRVRFAHAWGNAALALMNLGEYVSALSMFEALAVEQEEQGDERGLEATRANIAACQLLISRSDK